MQAAEMDVRLSRRPIERYEWPLGAALIALALSILIPERQTHARTSLRPCACPQCCAWRWRRACQDCGRDRRSPNVPLFICVGAAPGIDAYRDGKFEDAYGQFQQTLKSHPESRAEDKLQFDSGAALTN